MTQLLRLLRGRTRAEYRQVSKAQPQGLRRLLYRCVPGLVWAAFMIRTVTDHTGKTQLGQ